MSNELDTLIAELRKKANEATPGGDLDAQLAAALRGEK